LIIFTMNAEEDRRRPRRPVRVANPFAQWAAESIAGEDAGGPFLHERRAAALHMRLLGASRL
jgi:hypothetical protein